MNIRKTGRTQLDNRDPLGQFAVEAGDRAAEPRPSFPQAEADLPLSLEPAPVARPQASNTAPPTRRFMPLVVMGIAATAFAAGAFLTAAYPSWLGATERAKTSVAHRDAAPRPAERPSTDEEPKGPVSGEMTGEAATRRSGTPRVADAEPRIPPGESHSDDAIGRAAADHAEEGPLSGEWSMNTRVESSRLKRYEGLRLAYQVRLRQTGNQLTGTGFKLRENDRTVATQTPITLRGEVDGDRVVMTFTERGTRRASAGKLVFDRESDNVLRGRFSSDAAVSTGIVEARR